MDVNEIETSHDSLTKSIGDHQSWETLQLDTQNYTVGGNETIKKIAKRFCITHKDLVAINHFPSAKQKLNKGDVIKVPAVSHPTASRHDTPTNRRAPGLAARLTNRMARSNPNFSLNTNPPIGNDKQEKHDKRQEEEDNDDLLDDRRFVKLHDMKRVLPCGGEEIPGTLLVTPAMLFFEPGAHLSGNTAVSIRLNNIHSLNTHHMLPTNFLLRTSSTPDQSASPTAMTTSLPQKTVYTKNFLTADDQETTFAHQTAELLIESNVPTLSGLDLQQCGISNPVETFSLSGKKPVTSPLFPNNDPMTSPSLSHNDPMTSPVSPNNPMTSLVLPANTPMTSPSVPDNDPMTSPSLSPNNSMTSPVLSANDSGTPSALPTGDCFKIETDHYVTPQDLNNGTKSPICSESTAEPRATFGLEPGDTPSFTQPQTVYLSMRGKRYISNCEVSSPQRLTETFVFSVPTDAMSDVLTFLLQEGVGLPESPSSRPGSFSRSMSNPSSFMVVENHFEGKDHAMEYGPISTSWEMVDNHSVVADALREMEAEKFRPQMLDGASEILDDRMLNELCDSFPSQVIGWNLQLLHQSSQHGFSLTLLYRKMRDLEPAPALLLIKDSRDTVFGAFMSEKMHLSQYFYGKGSTFIFHWRPDFRKYAWTRKNSFFMKGDSGCFSIGGTGGHNAIWFDDTLKNGRTEATDTFDNPSLSGDGSTSSDFTINTLELWNFVQ